jgi:hypothetical protein
VSTSNETAWEELFAERRILDDVNVNGFHSITAAAIKKKREPRLMTKFDHTINLPRLFAQNSLAILPDSRSSYVIGRFDCYAKTTPSPELAPLDRTFPDWIQSLASTNLYSESAVLLCALHAGILADVLDEEVSLTVFGRMSTGEFDFSIRSFGAAEPASHSLRVDRAQCEIDGGFEGPESFAIVEVKNEAVEDFHVRQLYYPFRLWTGRLGSKRVVPVFLTYSNEVFTFSVYQFDRLHDYSSLRLIGSKRYQIVPNDIEVADIRNRLRLVSVQPEPSSVPFPQADRFERVIDLLTRLSADGGTLTQEEITTNYAFDHRQTQYYTNAARYLGLVERTEERGTGVTYLLTALGTGLMNKTPRDRNLTLVELLLARQVFREAVERYLIDGDPPSTSDVVRIMDDADLDLNQTTRERRAQTVIGWARWMMSLTG